MKEINKNNIEVEQVSVLSVSCFGKEAPYDHPKVFLSIDKVTNEAVCPYCSKKFVKK